MSETEWKCSGCEVIGPAGRPANTCATCRYFVPLATESGAICMMRWRGLPWTAAVPMTTADDSCDKHDTPPAPRATQEERE